MVTRLFISDGFHLFNQKEKVGRNIAHNVSSVYDVEKANTKLYLKYGQN